MAWNTGRLSAGVGLLLWACGTAFAAPPLTTKPLDNAAPPVSSPQTLPATTTLANPVPATTPSANAASANTVTPVTDGANVFRNGKLFHLVHLQNDGNLAGRVSVFDASGTRRPVQARIVFAKDGQIVKSVHSDEWGRFQVPGMKPDVYSVLVVGQQAFGAFSVRVTEFTETALSDELLIDAPLVPINDAPVFGKLITEETNTAAQFFPASPGLTAGPGATAPGAEAGAAGGGGAGGGLSGLGGLLGALGAFGGGGGSSGGGGGSASASNSAPTQ